MNSEREYSDTPTESLRQQVFKHLNKNHELKPKELCKLMDKDYKKYGKTITQYRNQWKRKYKNRQTLKRWVLRASLIKPEEAES